MSAKRSLPFSRDWYEFQEGGCRPDREEPEIEEGLTRFIGALYGGLGFSAITVVICLYFTLSPMLYFVIPGGLLGMVLGLIFPEFFANLFSILFGLFGL